MLSRTEQEPASTPIPTPPAEIKFFFTQKKNHPLPLTSDMALSSNNQSTEVTNTSEPGIYIIGTGGTIVGTAASAVSQTYQPSQLSVATLVENTPELKNLNVDITVMDLFRVHSENMKTRHWLTLAKEVNSLLSSQDVKGIVITHGTDTLEETAYFLHLVTKSIKPVVLVGAMRPATSLSSDGPMNLYNAVALASSPEAVNRGVMVAMDEEIHSALDVTKSHTTKVDTFISPNTGRIGSVQAGKVKFERQLCKKHTVDTPFDVAELTKLPRVVILACCSGMSTRLISLLAEDTKKPPQGIVIEGVGDGNIPAKVKAKITYFREKGIPIIRSSRVGSGYVTENDEDFPKVTLGTVSGQELSPQKARILLMLSLTLTNDLEAIHKNYLSY